MSAEIVPSGDSGLRLSSNLPKTPGWEKLSEVQREGIQKITSMFLQGVATEFGAKMMQEVACLRAEKFLDGTPMSVQDWASMNVGPNYRKIYRALEKARPNLKYVTEDDLIFLAEHGIPGLSNVHTGHVFNVLPKVPAPKFKPGTPPRQIEAAREVWSGRVAEAVSSGFSERRKSHKPIALTEEGVVTNLVQTHRAMRRSLAELTSAQKAKLLKRAWGYSLQILAIPGPVQVERTPIPDGVLPPQGAPRGKRKKRKKSA